MDDIDQHEVHGECAVALMALAVECNMMVSHLGITQQSHQRSVVAVPNPTARSGLSMEHVDGPKGITWSSVVTKNSLEVDGSALQMDSDAGFAVSGSWKPVDAAVVTVHWYCCIVIGSCAECATGGSARCNGVAAVQYCGVMVLLEVLLGGEALMQLTCALP
ncbi:hypothetical protein Nepgr_003844 [Nepenthes gracilis]|uniref:Uncharacterized protein n=1 Tax=Nepenthes gracilis TaxID=150966 RepID=A0AAD3S098_NEPGR|nr:hypothetical protein Nepgr_003844 [Nepenthes gracilis]